MIDVGHCENPVLASLLAAASRLHPATIDLRLDRLERLLVRLGNPHKKLPPVFHVAGTNGKGSTCAFLRAGLEASGRRVHVYTSPHLVRFNERIRLAGNLIDDATLITNLRDVLDINGLAPLTFFELTTAVALLAFSRTPADAAIIEVGMGGRLDATNVVHPIVTGIAALGLDHQQWLGSSIIEIAREKAGIAKRGVPLVVSRYPRNVAAQVAEVAGLAGAKLLARGDEWDAVVYQDALHLRDGSGKLSLPVPRLLGAHQADNAALAVAMLRAQRIVPVADAALRAAMGWVEWPARLQKLAGGSLIDLLPEGSEVWLDGAHNPSAARVIAQAFANPNPWERPLYLVVGMLETKDVAGFLKHFSGCSTTVYAVPIGKESSHLPEAIKSAAQEAGIPANVTSHYIDAFRAIAEETRSPPIVLVTGSLYLAGAVLAANGQVPI